MRNGNKCNRNLREEIKRPVQETKECKAIISHSSPHFLLFLPSMPTLVSKEVTGIVLLHV